MRSHVKASFAAPIQASDRRQVRIGLACLMVLGLVAFLGIGAPAASAVDTCPNVVFRTGPSAKLPECRAYELVSPAYTGGLPPTYESFAGDVPGMFDTDTVTPGGDSVVYNTLGGGLPGFSATGYVDRYRARRSAGGWTTEPISPGGDQMVRGGPGGISADHEYSVGAARELSAKLWPAFVGSSADMLRTPSGYEPLARGSLGDAKVGTTDWITANGTHVLFTAETKLEPNAPASGTRAVYDRTPGGPTHVVSLLPGDVTPNRASHYLGATKDGTEVAFEVGQGGEANPIFVRRDNAVTKEVVRPSGVTVGKELECTGGPGSATLAYQWLRNGSAIGGATASTYTATAADEGAVVQCRVTASNSEGVSVGISATRVVEPYQQGSFPETSGFASISAGITSAAVGTLLSCGNAGFEGSPTLAYQWLSEGTAIGGATASTYTPVEADAGSSLQCRITASSSDGTAVAYSFNQVSIYRATPKASANPAISNISDPADSTPDIGDELSCSNGTWTNSPSFAYQWLRNGSAIGGATASTYTTVAEDAGKTLQCRVTATNAGGSVQAVSARAVVDPQPGTKPPLQTSPGGVFGTAAVGSELFCGAGGWEGGPSFTYQWLRNGTDIGGATSSSYTLTSADAEAVVQCRLTATNAGGATVAIDAGEGAKVVTRAIPAATASLPNPTLIFDGIFNGRVFYSDGSPAGAYYYTNPGHLYMYDLDSEKTTTIVPTNDASIVNVSEDGSHVYFLTKSLIDGEGQAGKPNLGVWVSATESSTFIATVSEEDMNNNGVNQTSGLNTWEWAIAPPTYEHGRAISHTRSTSDGSVFVFESTAQLTGFDNTEASAEDCGGTSEGAPIPGQPCDEVYRYDAAGEELTCVSCGTGAGPASGYARLQSISFAFGGVEGGTEGVEPAAPYSPVESLTEDGDTVFFESSEGLVPEDGNETKDVYRWTKGKGVELISTGQSEESALYGVTPGGSDVIFGTRSKLLPQDENGSTVRLYDARVDGGFPPPEETVTEPCSGDACQGQAAAAPETPNVASSSLNGGGNVPAKLKCAKHSRRVVRKGSERCVAHKHHKRHRRAGHRRRAAR